MAENIPYHSWQRQAFICQRHNSGWIQIAGKRELTKWGHRCHLCAGEVKTGHSRLKSQPGQKSPATNGSKKRNEMAKIERNLFDFKPAERLWLYLGIFLGMILAGLKDSALNRFHFISDWRFQSQPYITDSFEHLVSLFSYHIVSSVMALQNQSCVEQFLQMK